MRLIKVIVGLGLIIYIAYIGFFLVGAGKLAKKIEKALIEHEKVVECKVTGNC